MVLVRPIEYDDVTAAIELLMDGSLMPEFEDVTKVDHYWSAVEEMRRNAAMLLSPRSTAKSSVSVKSSSSSTSSTPGLVLRDRKRARAKR